MLFNHSILKEFYRDYVHSLGVTIYINNIIISHYPDTHLYIDILSRNSRTVSPTSLLFYPVFISLKNKDKLSLLVRSTVS